MASQQRDDEPGRRNDDASRLVYVPCPACGRGVRLSDENRIAGEDDAYECPACGARLIVSED
jgi:DNA-directed RNA polymerase subunit RPC12/RpoP